MRAWAVLLLALAGCGRAAPTAPPRPVFQDTPYFPLQVGATWTYQGDKHKLVTRVVKREEFGGGECAVLESHRDGKRVATQHWYSDADGVYFAGVEGRRLAPALPFMKLPPPKAGASWEKNVREGSHVQKALFVQSEAEVRVPAGKYRTVEVQSEFSVGGVRQRSAVYWFAEGVGIVKQVIRQGETRLTYELESYEPGK